jgi:hypothetical protein
MREEYKEVKGGRSEGRKEGVELYTCGNFS